MNSNNHNDYKLLVQQSIINTIDKLQYHLTLQDTSTEYIHRIRVDIKHLRAWLRLIRNNKQNWKHIDKRLLEYSKQLGSTRDNQTTKDTLFSLNNIANTPDEHAAIAHVYKQLSLVLKHSKINWEEFKHNISCELDMIKHKHVSFDTIKILENGMKKTYSKARHLGKKAFSKQGSYDDLHKHRKWVKYLNYQLGYLNKRTNIKRNVEKLGHDLGKAHDLIIIKEKLRLLDENKHINIVYKLIDENINLILKRSSKTYKNIFNKSSEIFVDQFKF